MYSIGLNPLQLLLLMQKLSNFGQWEPLQSGSCVVLTWSQIVWESFLAKQVAHSASYRCLAPDLELAISPREKVFGDLLQDFFFFN